MRYIIFCFYLIVFISCDRELTFDFYVKNTCNKEIKVLFENNNDKADSSIIEPNNERKILSIVSFGPKIGTGQINIYKTFKYFIIRIDTIESKIDYRTNNLWDYNKLSETHAEYRLTIDSTDFK